MVRTEYLALALLVGSHLMGAFLSRPAVADGPVESKSHIERIRQAGKLDFRCFPQLDSPFLKLRLEQGPLKGAAGKERFDGIDVEILARIADRLGVELQLRPVAEPSMALMFESLDSKDGDIAGGGITITPPRRKRMVFTRPYVEFFAAGLVRIDHFPSIRDLGTLRLAILRGSSFDEMLTDLGLPEDRILREDFNTGTIERLIAGTADITFFDSCALPEEVGFSLRPAFRFPEPQHIGFALPLGSDLKPVVDSVLEDMEAAGDLDRLLSRFLRSVDEDSVDVIRPEDFCRTDCTGSASPP